MFKRSSIHPRFGEFHRSLGPWKGRCYIKGWNERDDIVDIVAETKSAERLTELLDELATVFDDDGLFACRIRDDLFESYCFHKRMDIEEAGMAPEEFERHPEVAKAEDVYAACTPDRMRLGDEIDRYLGNVYLLFDVDWPNDHFLQLWWHLEPGVFEFRHFDLVG